MVILKFDEKYTSCVLIFHGGSLKYCREKLPFTSILKRTVVKDSLKSIMISHVSDPQLNTIGLFVFCFQIISKDLSSLILVHQGEFDLSLPSFSRRVRSRGKFIKAISLCFTLALGTARGILQRNFWLGALPPRPQEGLPPPSNPDGDLAAHVDPGNDSA